MTISSILRGEMFASETGDGLLYLLTLDHADLPTPIRLVRDQVNITSRGNEFIAVAFDVKLPTSDPESPDNGQLIVDNVSRDLMDVVRSISGSISVVIEFVRIDALDEVAQAYLGLSLSNIRYDFEKITGDLTAEDLYTEPLPYLTFNPAYFPGLFP